MRSSRLLSAIVAATLATLAVAAHAQTDAEPDPFSALPSVNPQQLLQLATLNDSAFLQRLFNGGRSSALLDRYFPPGTAVFPLSHGFAGPQEACQRTRTAPACRLHVEDLITVNLGRSQNNGVFSNPFAPAR